MLEYLSIFLFYWLYPFIVSVYEYMCMLVSCNHVNNAPKDRFVSPAIVVGILPALDMMI